MDQRIAVQQTGARIGQPDRITGGQSGANQLLLGSIRPIRRRNRLTGEQPDRDAPTDKGDFIHWGVDRRLLIPGHQKAGQRTAERSKATDKIVIKQADASGPAVMADCPAQLDALLLCGPHPRSDRRKVIMPIAFT